MSELKITGNPTPTVGKAEFYSVNQLLSSAIPTKIFDGSKLNAFEYPVEWSVHILENGRWIQKEENDKTGNKVSYTFIQKSLERKGIRILAKRGNQVARLDIKPHKAESPKIESIEFLDRNGNKPTKPFAYGQTLKARVHCLHMERRTIYATLWEDDAAGAGHNKANEKNKMKTLPGTVKGGIADIDFVLEPDFAKIANAIKAKGDTDEGKTHEYYVTAEILNKKTASANTNVANPSYKDTTAQPAAPKKETPAQKKGPSKKQEKQKEKEKSIGDDIIDWWEGLFKVKPIVAPNPKAPTGNNPLKIGEPDKNPKDEKKEKNGLCVCKDYDLIWGNKVSCDFRKKVVEISKNLGLPQEKNEGANWLMAVMALETGRTFSPTCGTFKKHKDDTKNGYVGLIQIGKVAAIDLGVKRSELIKLSATAQLDYVEKFFKQKKFDGKLKTKTDLYLAVNYPNACGHGTEKNYVVYDSTKDAYDDNPIFKREKDEYWIDKKGKKHYYAGKKGSSYAWEFEEAINDLHNEGIPEKIIFFGTCPIVLNNTTDKDIVTYNIYSDGKIEKIIPKTIKEGYENRYKYVYHDKKNKEHPICILDWYNTKGKEVGIIHNSKPTHAEVLTDEKVSDGSTSRRVKYKNDDIAEYGKHPTKGLIWRLYKSTGNDIELIKMPDSLNYSKDGIVIKYSFSQTKRKYTGPNVFAGFIGALAECSYSEGITTTGSCFKEGSCFPSAEHVNGRSVDTIYYNSLIKDQSFIDAIIKFKFTEVLVGNNHYCKQIKNAEDGGALHNSHLHSGNFNNDSIIISKK
ncbi:hypothetical protein DOS84_09770 [Flavobacterium aquariorum]|uniref:Transglycosylase SLT domain-containing protein n=1 Tax=Flavobacterium aquariorum TaxID=2217670 RepID=A0A2W7TWB8_9FLAO|nr:hypothetical protein [Flavobacterium aquariorum]PZX93686.1 hypothetical protein DOS84_09770 [Flavobacterium aquariorum]